MPALFYFHIPTTIGTGVIDVISQHYVEPQILTNSGDLTVPFLQACGEERLRDVGFIHGHVGPGAAAYLQGIAKPILLLRDPMDRMVSHYLDMLGDANSPWHGAATELGLRDFIETYPRFLALQTISLATGLGHELPRDRVYDCLPDILSYLESTFLLGTVEQIDEFMAGLATMEQWPAPVTVPHLNNAAAGEAPAREVLEDAYVAVARSAHVGAMMIAAEEAVYTAAKSIAVTQRGRMPSREPVG